MKRFEKYKTTTTSSNTPERISILLKGAEVGEIYVRDGEMELRAPWSEEGLQDVHWRADITGWGKFSAEERDHYMHEAIRRLDLIVDPEGNKGDLDPEEDIPELPEMSSGPDL